ncbi:MAG: DUF951 domain-containing protein [Clostridia bacterium]
MEYNLNDTIITKKVHPCGGNEWTIVRVGADIKLKCKKCGHTVMIDYANFGKIVKKHIKAE